MAGIATGPTCEIGDWLPCPIVGPRWRLLLAGRCAMAMVVTVTTVAAIDESNRDRRSWEETCLCSLAAPTPPPCPPPHFGLFQTRRCLVRANPARLSSDRGQLDRDVRRSFVIGPRAAYEREAAPCRSLPPGHSRHCIPPNLDFGRDKTLQYKLRGSPARSFGVWIRGCLLIYARGAQLGRRT